MKQDPFFTYFKESIDSYTLPRRFTFPFYYDPHPLCRLAVKELQEMLSDKSKWDHDFGLERYIEGTNIGKMFGVLIVQNQAQEIGYLVAFSGKLSGRNNCAGFVPPIFDSQEEGGFYRKEETQINEINAQLYKLESAPGFHACKLLLETETHEADNALEQARVAMKQAKKDRKLRREKAQRELDEASFETVRKELANESMKAQYDYKDLSRKLRQRIDTRQAALDVYINKIHDLKEERKSRSAKLQQKLFDCYQFLNIKGDTMSVLEVFKDSPAQTPPSGAGDCAGPKLLQYAFQQKLKPLAMAEFWWGQSPNSEIRKHGNYYPACKGKCEPILGHMLKGMLVDDNPMIQRTQEEKILEIIYEDEEILLINKPFEFLSVPGKTPLDSVYDRIKKKYPNATGPLIVHRLDMSTSGLMVIAKTKESHKFLQSQFLKRTVQKRYVALLDGIVTGDEGIIDLPLRVDLDDRPRQLVCYEYGKTAKTQWKVIERANGKTRIHFHPITGRTHQLRVHAAHPKGLNIPIVGDDLYGQKGARLHLHAEYIEIKHPRTKEIISFQLDAEF